MSKVQELVKNRKENGTDVTIRLPEKVDGAASLESYYENILSDADIDKAVDEYKGHYDDLASEFIERTRIQSADLGFLFVAIALQCLRIYVIDKITTIEKANAKGGKEDKIHEFQDKLLGKFSNGGTGNSKQLYASLEDIIATRGVPYDAQAPFDEEIKKLHLFSGANHRFTTLGHDPLLGLVFGTANILTNTITLTPQSENVLKKLPINLEKTPLLSMLSVSLPKTHQVVYSDLKNPKIGMPVSTTMMIQSAIGRFENDKKAVAAAIIKQLLHIATDMYTPVGIQLPGASLVLTNATVEKLTDYISSGDIVKVGASAGTATLINMIISAVHGCKLLFEDDGQAFSKELYQARTRKILMYSNVIATSSNVITTALGDTTSLDIGGLLVTLHRVISDTKFISKLEYEFINTSLSNLYREKYGNLLY